MVALIFRAVIAVESGDRELKRRRSCRKTMNSIFCCLAVISNRITPVACSLILGTARPVSWTVGASSGAHSLEIWLPNYVEQVLSGVPQGVRVLRYPESIPASRTRLFEDRETLQDTGNH